MSSKKRLRSFQSLQSSDILTHFKMGWSGLLSIVAPGRTRNYSLEVNEELVELSKDFFILRILKNCNK